MSTNDGKLVINCFGAPGAGKTVAATSLFARLKREHVEVVLVSEFAHQKVVEENRMGLSNQLWIWANQQYSIYCGYQHARVVVTDAPILLGYVYNKGNIPLQDLIVSEHAKYNNFNIVLDLDSSYPYSMVGRIHDFSESVVLEREIIGLLESRHIPFLRRADYDEDEIVEVILSTLE